VYLVSIWESTRFNLGCAALVLARASLHYTALNMDGVTDGLCLYNSLTLGRGLMVA